MNIHKSAYFFVILYALTSVAAADPTSDFNSIVEKCKAAFEARPIIEVSENQKSQAWVKKLYSPTAVTFDAKRSDSIINPLSGYIEVVEMATFKSDANKEIVQVAELSLSDTSTPALRFVTRINYGFNGTTWSVLSGAKSTAFRRVGASSFERNPEPIPYSADKIKSLEGPISKCTNP